MNIHARRTQICMWVRLAIIITLYIYLYIVYHIYHMHITYNVIHTIMLLALPMHGLIRADMMHRHHAQNTTILLTNIRIRIRIHVCMTT